MSNYIDWVHDQESEATPEWLAPSDELSGNKELERISDVIMTRLRTSGGLDLDYIRESFQNGIDKVERILEGASLALELGMAERIKVGNNSGMLRLVDPDGFLFSNTIISSIFVELGIMGSDEHI